MEKRLPDEYIEAKEKLSTCLNLGLRVCPYVKSSVTEECLTCRDYYEKEKFDRYINELTKTLDEDILRLKLTKNPEEEIILDPVKELKQERKNFGKLLEEWAKYRSILGEILKVFPKSMLEAELAMREDKRIMKEKLKVKGINNRRLNHTKQFN